MFYIDIVRWENRTVPKVPWTHYISQALTGHGCFQYYPYWMCRAASISHCMHCFWGSDTAEHTLFRYKNWDGLQADLCERLGITPLGLKIFRTSCVALSLKPDLPERGLALKEAEETFRLGLRDRQGDPDFWRSRRKKKESARWPRLLMTIIVRQVSYLYYCSQSRTGTESG